VAAPRCHAAAIRPVRNSRTQLCDAAQFLCPASCHTLHHPLTRRPSATAGNYLRNLCAPTSKRAKGNLSTYTEQRTPALIDSHIILPVDTTPHKRENRQSVGGTGGGGDSNTERAKWLHSTAGSVRTGWNSRNRYATAASASARPINPCNFESRYLNMLQADDATNFLRSLHRTTGTGRSWCCHAACCIFEAFLTARKTN
jgi:hypothetical protein